MKGDSAVHAAIERWERDGLVTNELAEELRGEVTEGAASRTRRTAQYLIAITASVVLFAATVLFVGRSWSDLEVLTRTFVLGVIGVCLLLFGSWMERRPRVRPVGYLLQTSGLLMLLVAYAHSDQTWSKGSPGGIIVGMLALATPILSVAVSLRRDPVMPAINAAVAYAFVAFFLERIGIDPDSIVWILDGILAISLLVLGFRLKAAGPDTPDVARVLYAFIASLLAGLVLAGLTAAGPLDAGGETIFALDLWLGLIVALTLWAVHRAPSWLARAWYDDVLAACVLIGAVFAFITLHEVGVADDWLAVGGATVGAIGLLYGVRSGSRSVLIAGCGAIVVSVWIFGIQHGRSLGAVGALAFTAALLFWVSSRLGRDQPEVTAEE